MSPEEKIYKVARFALVALLFATLGWAGKGRADGASDEKPMILVATRELKDSFFRSSILVVKPIGNGRHVGLVINHPTEFTLGRLFPEHGPSRKVPDPVYLGGPINSQYIFALVQGDRSPGDDALQISPDLYLAADAPTVDRIIESDASHARFFAGLVSWSPGELQEEMKRGLWFTLESDSALVMRKSTEGLWEELVARSERRANAI